MTGPKLFANACEARNKKPLHLLSPSQAPPDQQLSGAQFAPVVIMRKMIHGTRSDKGLENHSVLRSLFETARRQRKKPRQFF